MKAAKVFSAVFLLAVLFASVASAQSSSSSTIEQQIQARECSYTTIETGLGKVHDSTCPFFAPTIEKINKNSDRPVISGMYDAVHTTKLRVQVGGVWYVLGESTELTADGNVWMLNLSRLKHALSEGEYVILVEATGDDDKVRTGRATMEIARLATGQESGVQPPVSAPDLGEGEPTPGVPQPKPEQPAPTPTPAVPIKEAVRTSFIPLFFLVALTGWVLLFILSRRRRTRESRWSGYYDIMHSEAPEWLSTTSQREERE